MPRTPPTFRFVEHDGTRALEAGGSWTVFSIRGFRHKHTAHAPARVIDVSRVKRLDTAGVLELLHLAHGGKDIEIRTKEASQAELFQVVQSNVSAGSPEHHVNWIAHWLDEVGHSIVHIGLQFVALCAFFGESLAIVMQALQQPSRFRLNAVIRQMYEVWVRALPIVGVLCFLIGVVTAYQGVQQLRQFGAETFTVEAVGIGMFRELGVLLTAIIVAGRSGSAFTAQIGTMQVNQEVDAMRTMGLNPVEWLVLPRILALVISLPLLAFWGDMTGLLGGAVACTIYLDFTFVQFFERLRDTVGIWHFYTGLIKAPVFGAFIAAIGCFEGLQVHGSAESVGQLTTRSVVESIFCVIVLDAIFSVIFLLAGV
jgi:phospholipid/cholesterol/gamma-HCH transport system permease protein